MTVEAENANSRPNQGRIAAQMSWKVSHKRLLIILAVLVGAVSGSWYSQGWGLGYGPCLDVVFFVAALGLLVFCFLLTINGIGGKKPVLLFTLLWVGLSAALFNVPGKYLARMAAVRKVHRIGPELIVEEGRELMRQFQVSAGDADYWRWDFDDPNIPMSMRQLNPWRVTIVREEVVLKMHGGFDFWAGFVVVPMGRAYNNDEIAEGLYWDDLHLYWARIRNQEGR